MRIGGGHGAALHPAEQPALAEVVQIAADRLWRHVVLARQFVGAPADARRLEDLPLPRCQFDQALDSKVRLADDFD